MKGYDTYSGYMGWIGDRYMLFSCERDYIEWMEDDEQIPVESKYSL